jgi:hypothetical protein
VEESLKETFYACAIIDGEERRFPFDSREAAREYTTAIENGTAPEFEGKKISSVWTEGLEDKPLTEELHEEKDLDISEKEFEELINSPEFKKPISDNEVEAIIDSSKESEEESPVKEDIDLAIADLDEIQESVLETLISDSLVEAYGNVVGFKLNECTYIDKKFTVDGTIYFASGNTRKTTYTFNESCEVGEGKIGLHGLNEKLGLDKQFTLIGRIDNKTLVTESFKRSK